MTNIDQFLNAYIECALWSSVDDDGEPLDKGCNKGNIAPDTLATMRSECEDFISSFSHLLDQCDLSIDHQGHDFWLTRNRCGAGFWDRGIGTIGRHLTDAAHSYGSFYLYIGDDGMIYGQ